MMPPNTAGNPLSAASLSTFMAASLPKGSDGADPQLKTTYEAVALASHACMIAVGFRLVGLGEDDRIGKLRAAAVPEVAVHAFWPAFPTMGSGLEQTAAMQPRVCLAANSILLNCGHVLVSRPSGSLSCNADPLQKRRRMRTTPKPSHKNGTLRRHLLPSDTHTRSQPWNT
jgi:hypothetical protein